MSESESQVKVVVPSKIWSADADVTTPSGAPFHLDFFHHSKPHQASDIKVFSVGSSATDDRSATHAKLCKLHAMLGAGARLEFELHHDQVLDTMQLQGAGVAEHTWWRGSEAVQVGTDGSAAVDGGGTGENTESGSATCGAVELVELKVAVHQFVRSHCYEAWRELDDRLETCTGCLEIFNPSKGHPPLPFLFLFFLFTQALTHGCCTSARLQRFR
jgi:hypothetical protein